MFGIFKKSKNLIVNPTVLIVPVGATDVALVEHDRAIYDGLFPHIDVREEITVSI